MLHDIMYAEYSQAEAAAGVGHPNFSDFRRNAQREKLLVMPHITRKPYSYAAILEMAVFMSVSTVYSRDIGRGVNIALNDALKSNAMLSRNEELSAAMSALSIRGTDMKREAGELASAGDDDHNLAARIDNFGWAVFAPGLLLGDEAISRDRTVPTFAVFIPTAVPHNIRALRLIDTRKGDVTITRVRDIAREIATDGASDERTAYFFAESAAAPGLIDLTEICVRMDDALGMRLKARSIGRRS